LELEVLLD